jgi:hypothetical protein
MTETPRVPHLPAHSLLAGVAVAVEQLNGIDSMASNIDGRPSYFQPFSK